MGNTRMPDPENNEQKWRLPKIPLIKLYIDELMLAVRILWSSETSFPPSIKVSLSCAFSSILGYSIYDKNFIGDTIVLRKRFIELA